MGKKTLPYIGLCTGTYLLISAFEIFLCHPLVDFIGFGYRIHLIVYAILLLAINPYLVRFCTDKLPLSRNTENTQRGELL